MNKKILLVSGLIVLMGGFFAYEKFLGNASPAPILNNTTGASAQNNIPQQAVSSNPPPSSPPANGLKDGTYIGLETNSMYGLAKAQITVSSGKIVDVKFLEYPNDRQASMMKSNMAMPIIRQEVISAQSANVNTVSGATQTADSFMQSIASAISQAS